MCSCHCLRARVCRASEEPYKSPNKSRLKGKCMGCLKRAVLKTLFCLFVFSGVGFAEEKPAIVLVHGAFQDAQSTWSKVEPELKAMGYKVLAVNLPGRNSDQTDAQKLTTKDYKQAVLKMISAETHPLVLVGHSFGGITISNVAEAAPEKIKALIYLSAYLPQNGDSLQSLSQTDADSKLGQDGNFVVSLDYKYASVKPEHFADLSGNDAKGVVKEAIGKDSGTSYAHGQPCQTYRRPLRTSPQVLHRDHRRSDGQPALQGRMTEGAGVKRVFKAAVGHATYVTQPRAVAKDILAVAAQ